MIVKADVVNSLETGSLKEAVAAAKPGTCHVSIQLELVSNAFDLEHRNIQDTFYANDKALVKMDTLRFGQLCLGILSLLVIQVLSIFVLVCTS